MHIVIIILLLLAAVFGPQLWAQYTFKRYAKPRNDIPGNGAELARHLLEQLGMSHVKVEETNDGEDHYDPADKVVRLGPKNYGIKSLTAITVAAHEVGHAIQDHHNESKLALRTRLVSVAQVVQQMGAGLLVLLPIIALVSRSPLIGMLMFLAGIASMGVATIVHFVTLPVEYDASFNKALPILIKGNYIDEKDRPAARRILKAAALTYVAASLASLLNLWRWIAILRR
jgi:Zn-dependent membrane protease YugP